MAAILTILALSILFCNSMPCYDATETDVYCLKSLFSSVEDPFGYLATSWNFDNTHEGFICNFMGVGCWHPDENKVLSIRMSGMGLRGSFPLGLSNCTSLTGLDLSNNNFSGPIPPDIAHMLRFVTTLNLSINNFSGEIPDGIADLSYLNRLAMDSNRLEGRIPRRLGSLSRLKRFSVANNNLSGEVPVFSNAYYYLTADSYEGNPGLCGPPLKPCRHDKPRKKLPIEFVGGFAVGYVIFFLLAVVGFMVLSVPKLGRQKKVVAMRRRKETQFVGLLRTNRSNIRIKFLNLEKYLNRMSFTEIKRATNNFNKRGVISVGKTGTMHKATLPNGRFIAVKKLYHSQCFDANLMNVALILTTLRHPNLVPLLGFSEEAKERLLVYAYMPNLNLHHWLHPPDQEPTIFLDWPSRLKIAIAVSRGLTWLHNNPHFRVLHLGLTSKAILLDHNLMPKISSFGNAKITNRGCSVEMKDSGFVHKDVRDFGKILLEMIAGKEESTNGGFVFIDEALVGRGFDGEIYELIEIASTCVFPSPERKPSMLQVFEAIKNIGQPEYDGETWVASNASTTSSNGIDGEIEEISE